MAWEAHRTNQRINKLMSSVPDMVTERFENAYLPRFLEESRIAVNKGLPAGKPLVNLPENKAVIVDGVHIYATLVNFDEYRLEDGNESEASHARALNFLHLHYQACDRVIERYGAHRVDFHGPRVHIVVAEPAGLDNSRERVMKALQLAKEIRQLSEFANEAIAEGKYPAEIRIGIDAGICAAINSGQGVEQEPLFLGSPANHAAKLATGNEPGIYVSDNIRTLFSLDPLATIELERQFALNESMIKTMEKRTGTPELQSYARQLLDEWQMEIRKQQDTYDGGSSQFQFHHHQPPLATINYRELTPGNSIRMPLISMFADIDGYTRYIDQAVSNNDVKDAICALHVIRGELCNVLEDDFKGRKVRFIGDCIQGIIAEGDSSRTDYSASVDTALHCAGAMRSSFQLCQEQLPDIRELGLAIGIELGPTSVSRVGIRGDRSVRLATSIATTQSEALQKECDGNQTAVGHSARDAASSDIQQMLRQDYILNDFGYDDAEMMSVETGAGVAAPAISRAHSCS